MIYITNKNKKRTGHFEVGNVKHTTNQVKKHMSQMSSEEIDYMKDKLRNLNITLSRHLKEKEDTFYMVDFQNEMKDLNNLNIIEYNETLTRNKFLDYRVLLRTNNTYEVNVDGRKEICQLCFVVSIKTGKIVTAYWNKSNDVHKSLNLSRYDKNIKIIKK